MNMFNTLNAMLEGYLLNIDTGVKMKYKAEEGADLEQG